MIERPDPGFPVKPAIKQFVIDVVEDPANAVDLEHVQRLVRAHWAAAPVGWHVWEVTS
jgi:hypothetical protein